MPNKDELKKAIKFFAKGNFVLSKPEDLKKHIQTLISYASQQAEPQATKEELKDERLREILEDTREDACNRGGMTISEALSAIKQEYASQQAEQECPNEKMGYVECPKKAEQEYQINDGKCYVCGKMTKSLSGRPSEWAIYLAHIDGQKQHRYYHTKCLYPILKAESEVER